VSGERGSQPAVVYVDYNIFIRVDERLSGTMPEAVTDARKLDYDALPEIWAMFRAGGLRLVTCEDEGFVEFLKYDRTLNNYAQVQGIPAPGIARQFALFQEVERRKALLGPWGVYGWGSFPWGAPVDRIELMREMRKLLGLQPNSRKRDGDNDARHLLHCVLYGCDYFLTMDERLIRNVRQREHLIKPLLDRRGERLRVESPATLLAALRQVGSNGAGPSALVDSDDSA
jgi:hypothetical protein